jgi:[acyl-carrier-protein] S-malonyltransferase
MNNSRVMALFPGQGSQRVGMGKEFLDEIPVAKELFDRADSALGFSLSDLCLNGPEEKLTLTHFAQPAILTVSTIAFLLTKGSVKPTVAAGHSLGEYSALVAADSLSFEDAVKLVHRRGCYMQEAVAPGIGKMVAVLGKELSEIEDALSKIGLDSVDIANINAPGQIVLSGINEGIAELLSALGPGKYVDLPVSAPFHSRMMKPAADKLASDLASIEIKQPTFTVLSNVSAQPHTEPDKIRELLAEQVCSRVRWVECMATAQNQFEVECAYEFGSGKVLAGLMKRISRGFPVTAVSLPNEVSEMKNQAAA